MTILAHIDADGRALGFYDPEIHGVAVPATAFEISAAVHAAWIADTADQRWDGTALVPADPPPAPASSAEALRARRTARLAACDWTQLADAPLTPEARAAWGAYRQALREVPEQPGFPATVTWPEEPAA